MVIHNKFILVHMVKTGGTFLQIYFGKNIPGCKATGSGYRRHKPAKAVNGRSQFKFGVMRNPYSWYISWWAFQAVQRRPGNSLPALLVKDFSQSVRNLDAARGIIKQTKSPLFIDFDILQRFDIGVMTYKVIEMFCDSNRIFNDPRFDGFQSEHFLINTTISMEHLRDELVQLFEAKVFELSNEQKSMLYATPRINVSEHDGFTQYYNDEARKWVEHKERYLFKLFPDYKFEDLQVAETGEIGWPMARLLTKGRNHEAIGRFYDYVGSLRQPC